MNFLNWFFFLFFFADAHLSSVRNMFNIKRREIRYNKNRSEGNNRRIIEVAARVWCIHIQNWISSHSKIYSILYFTLIIRKNNSNKRQTRIKTWKNNFSVFQNFFAWTEEIWRWNRIWNYRKKRFRTTEKSWKLRNRRNTIAFCWINYRLN